MKKVVNNDYEVKVKRGPYALGGIHKEKDMLILAKYEGNPSTCIHKHFKQKLLLLEQKHILIIT